MAAPRSSSAGSYTASIGPGSRHSSQPASPTKAGAAAAQPAAAYGGTLSPSEGLVGTQQRPSLPPSLGGGPAAFMGAGTGGGEYGAVLAPPPGSGPGVQGVRLPPLPLPPDDPPSAGGVGMALRSGGAPSARSSLDGGPLMPDYELQGKGE